MDDELVTNRLNQLLIGPRLCRIPAAESDSFNVGSSRIRPAAAGLRHSRGPKTNTCANSSLSCTYSFPQSYLRGTKSPESNSQEAAAAGSRRNHLRALSPGLTPRFPCLRRPAIRDRESARSRRLDHQRAGVGLWFSCE